ncbi:hypothetical protein FOXYSP1_20929 [Fusarium oxysporum f. sp. phaseoli]
MTTKQGLAGKHVPAFAKWRQTSKQATVPLPSLFSRARNHNHSFAGPPLHRAQSPELSTNSIKTRPINTPLPNKTLANDTSMRRKHFYT